MARLATPLPRKALLASGALLAHARPLLAQDKAIDMVPVFAGVTSKNYTAQRDAIVARFKLATVGKLAQDADVGEVAEVLAALEPIMEMLGDDPEPMPAAPAVDDDGDMMDRLKSVLSAKGMSDEDIDAVLAAMKPEVDAAPAAMDDKDAKKDGKPAMDTVTKPAMDAAIRAAVALATRSATADTMARMNAIRAAEDLVRPIIGAVVAQDSAEAVLKLALDHAGVDLAGVPKDVGTYTALVRMIPKAADVAAASKPRVAMDAAASDSYVALFGANATRLLRA